MFGLSDGKWQLSDFSLERTLRAQAVGRQPPVAEARVQSQVSGIFGRQSETWEGFSSSTPSPTPRSVSFHRRSMVIHSSITDAIGSQQLTESLNNTLKKLKEARKIETS